MRRLFSSLKLRFLICYLLLTIVPIAILYGVTYAGAVRQAQQEIISVQTESMASNRLYLQYLLMSMESRYYQLASCSALEEIMDGSAGIAMQLRRKLAERGLLAPEAQTGSVRFENSLDEPEILELSRALFGYHDGTP